MRLIFNKLLYVLLAMAIISPTQAAQEFVHYALCRTGQTQAVIDGFYPVDLPLLRAGLQKLGASQVR